MHFEVPTPDCARCNATLCTTTKEEKSSSRFLNKTYFAMESNWKRHNFGINGNYISEPNSIRLLYKELETQMNDMELKPFNRSGILTSRSKKELLEMELDAKIRPQC
jgi:hypothetical protein